MKNNNDFSSLLLKMNEVVGDSLEKEQVLCNIFEEIFEGFNSALSKSLVESRSRYDCVLYKPQNFHARFYEPLVGLVKVPRGGITLAYRTPNHKNDKYKLGVAVCSLHDNYCKKTGVKIAEDYIRHGDLVRSVDSHDPMTIRDIYDTLEDVISRNYKHLRKEFINSPFFRELYDWNFFRMAGNLRF